MTRRFIARSYARLAALAALVLPSASLNANTIATARQHFANGDFVQMNAALAPVLRATPNNPEARALRAIARVGILGESEVPKILRSAFGAQNATLDFSAAEFDVFFPEYNITYARGLAFVAGSGGYSHTGARNGPAPSNQIPTINFTNNSASPFPLTFQIDAGSGTALVLRMNEGPSFNVQSGIIGGIETSEGGAVNINLQGFFGSRPLTQGPGARQARLVIPPGHSVDAYLWLNPGGTYRFSGSGPDGALPSSIAVRNGQALFSVSGRAPRLASAGALLAPAQALQSTIAADLAALPAGFQLTLFPEETGAATTTILAYADARLLLAEIAVLEALRNLSLSYNLNFTFRPSVLDSELLEFLAANPSFFTARTDNGGLAAARARARTLLLAAATFYTEASDAGLWTRPAPSSGAYLFTPDSAVDVAAEKTRYDTAVAQLVAALSGPVPLEDISSDLAENPALPDGASADLTPLFGAPVVNLRAALPALSEDRQIVRGSSAGLINTGLLPGLGSAGWESFLTSQDLADEEQTGSGSAALRIQRQSGTVTVAENTPALLSVFAEITPSPLYQWQRRVGTVYQDIPGATSPTLRIASASRADAGLYRARITDTRVANATPISSRDIRLVVTYPPAISAHPRGGSVALGQTVTLSVTAAGVPEKLTYIWRKNSVPIPRAIGATYRFVVGPDSAGDYDVIVANARGATPSQVAAVRIAPNIGRVPGMTSPRVVHAGSTLQLTYPVVGSGPLNYGWARARVAETTSVGGNSATLVLSNIGASDAGAYALRVSSPYGVATSPSTVVFVNLPPASLPPGTIVALTEDGATTTLTVGPTPLRFTDGSTFTYALYGSATRDSNGVLTGATLVRSVGTARSTYQLGFSNARNASYLRLGPVGSASGTALVTLPGAP